MTDPNAFLMGSVKTPSVSWKDKPIGTVVRGTIARPSRVMQQRDVDTDELLWWDEAKTQPKNQLVVYLDLGIQHPDREQFPDHEGVWALYCKSTSLLKAISGAVRATGSKGLEVGGTLTVTYVGDGEKKKKAYNAPRLFTAGYVAPPDPSTDFVASSADVSELRMPPGADPLAWAGLDRDGKERYAAALAARAQADEPPF